MSELAEFLTARYDEAERIALAAGEDDLARTWTGSDNGHDDGGVVRDGHGEHVVYDEGSPNTAQALHIALHDPARELRRIAGLRRIVAAHSDQHECADYEATQWPYRGCDVLRNLTVEFADHPGYKPEWGS